MSPNYREVALTEIENRKLPRNDSRKSSFRFVAGIEPALAEPGGAMAAAIDQRRGAAFGVGAPLADGGLDAE